MIYMGVLPPSFATPCRGPSQAKAQHHRTLAQASLRRTALAGSSSAANGDMAAMGQPTWSESPATGIGFGLGFAVMLDPARARRDRACRRTPAA